MSRFSLRFRVAGIPVTVDPGFWLISLLLGMSGTAKTLMIWVPAVFVGVLVHELGHAFMAKAFGAKPEITLYSMGGVTRSAFPQGQSYSRLRSALVTIAGPGAGFLLAGLTFVVMLVAPPAEGTTAFRIAAVMLWINLGWGLVNLLPVLPLDGGNLLRAALSGPGPEVGLMRTLWISVIVGPLVVAASWKAGLTWPALLFGLFTFSSGRQLYELTRARADRKAGLNDKLDKAHEALVDGDLVQAEKLSAEVAQKAKTKGLQIASIHLLAFARIEQGDPAKALQTLETLLPDQIDPFLQGACLLALDRPAEAIPLLERSAESGEQPRAIELLLQALEENGEHDRAREVRQAVAEASGHEAH